MCREIDYKTAAAFLNGYNFKQGNTEVKYYPDTDEVEMYLHGNKIAYSDRGKTYINLCGYNTLTTRARLNALCDNKLKQKNNKLYFDDEQIEDNKDYDISDFIY